MENFRNLTKIERYRQSRLKLCKTATVDSLIDDGDNGFGDLDDDGDPTGEPDSEGFYTTFFEYTLDDDSYLPRSATVVGYGANSKLQVPIGSKFRVLHLEYHMFKNFTGASSSYYLLTHDLYANDKEDILSYHDEVQLAYGCDVPRAGNTIEDNFSISHPIVTIDDSSVSLRLVMDDERPTVTTQCNTPRYYSRIFGYVKSKDMTINYVEGEYDWENLRI